MTELLSCPFCGGRAAAGRTYNGETTLFKVQCMSCPAAMKGYDQSVADAIDAWNTRAAPARCDAVTADDILSEIVERWNDLKRDEGAFPPGDRRAAMSEQRLWHAIQQAKAWLKTSRPVPPPSEAGREEIARIIYEAFPMDTAQYKPPWIPRGNSIRQDDARRAADKIRALPDPGTVAVASAQYRCTCGAEPYCAPNVHAASCPLAVTSTMREAPAK